MASVSDVEMSESVLIVRELIVEGIMGVMGNAVGDQGLVLNHWQNRTDERR